MMPARLKAGVSVQTDKKPRSSQLLLTQKELAERVGFEPTVRLPVQRFSRPSRSTTPAPLRIREYNHLSVLVAGTKAKLQPNCNPKHLLAEQGVDGISRHGVGTLN